MIYPEKRSLYFKYLGLKLGLNLITGTLIAEQIADEIVIPHDEEKAKEFDSIIKELGGDETEILDYATRLMLEASDDSGD